MEIEHEYLIIASKASMLAIILGINLIFFFTLLVFSGLINKRKTRELRNANLKSQLDPLTSLYNRRGFEEALLFSNMTSGYLLLADIDNFKNVNDIYGHQSGDNVLCEVAERLSNNVRHFDILARFGGEEFIIFVPTKSEEAAVLFSQRLIRVIAENSFFISSYNINLKITMSLGAVYVEDINFNFDTAYKLADESLYMAKKQGKNRMCLSQRDLS